MKTAQQLITELKALFPLAPLPEKIVNYEGGGFEPPLVKAFFQGRIWTDVTLETLRQYASDSGACLNFMSHEAFRYFLPAFLFMMLDDYDRVSGMTIYSSTLFQLNPDDGVFTREWHEERFSFTPAQKQLIAEILYHEHILHDEQMNYLAEEPLNSYWKDFLTLPL